MDVTIYHNPACGTSRGALTLIRQEGIEPTVVEYLKHPLDFLSIKALLERAGMSARALLRDKEPLCRELGLIADHWDEDDLIRQMAAHPILMNRPLVITPRGGALCRPSQRVLDLLRPATEGR